MFREGDPISQRAMICNQILKGEVQECQVGDGKEVLVKGLCTGETVKPAGLWPMNETSACEADDFSSTRDE